MDNEDIVYRENNKILAVIGQNAKRLAEASTQTELAARAGFSQKTASNLMAGINVQCDKIGGMATALRIPAFTLLIPGTFSAADARHMGRLVQSYLACADDGKTQILRTAEVEQRHAVMRKDGQG